MSYTPGESNILANWTVAFSGVDMWRKIWVQITLLTLLALGVRLIWGLSRLAMGLEFVDEGDYPLYTIGAQYILDQNNFANSLFLVRPPGFSLVVAALGLDQQAILIVNALLGALLAPLTFVLTYQMGLAHRFRLVSGVIVALDPVTIHYTAFLGPESLAFVGALTMMISLLAVIQSRSNRSALAWGGLAGLMLLLSVYARPSIYIIWVILVPWLLLLNWRRWAALLVFVLVSIGGMQLWVNHNEREFGNPTFSTVGAYTMTYYRAASVARLGSGKSLQDVELDIARRVETELGRDPSLVDEDTKHGYLAASPAVEQALYKVNLEIFLAYPLLYLATFPVGFVRMYQLIPPLNALGDIQHYPAVIWNWFILLTGAYGLYRATRQREWTLFWGVLLLFGYFTAGTLISKSAGLSGRERTIVFPYIAIASAYGILSIWHYLRQRRKSQPLPETSGLN